MTRATTNAGFILSRFVIAVSLAVLAGSGLQAPLLADSLSDQAARHTRLSYSAAAEATLADLVAFKTVNEPGTANADHPEFRRMTEYLAAKAVELGLGFEDYGAAVVLTLGDSEDRLGVVTHGDVQPAEASKWSKNPFLLDLESEPGRLIARGAEDDKGSIAAALYAMKTVADLAVPLERRVELIVSYTEESDWEPFRQFLKARQPPEINVVLDSEYPVVAAEKGWCSIKLKFSSVEMTADDRPQLAELSGGAFSSQVPGEARAVLLNSTTALEAALLAAARRDPEVTYAFTPIDHRLLVEAHGLATHASTPWKGSNALSHLAALLGGFDWPDSQAARALRFINDLVGAGHYAERFGDLAEEDPFVGKLTLTLTKLSLVDESLVATLNIRRTPGPSNEEFEAKIRRIVDAWSEGSGARPEIEAEIYAAYSVENAPQVPVLLDIFSRYTGRQDPKPIAIGGGTHARELPNAVNFGPAMPDVDYTGHSEHEFVTRDQFQLNLQMYTAMLVELAGKRDGG